MWNQRKPEVGHIRVFGYVAHKKVPNAHTTKLNDRSKLVVHLGKEPGIKAYRLYDPTSRVVHVRRDVIFEEEWTWMWEKHI